MNDLFLKQAMHRAVALAQRGIPATAPNPAVGAVLIRNAQIVAEGWHRQFGGPHAEADCLDDAVRKGVNPRGATMLVTLEPCNHHGKTPPCSQAILESGVSRVICGCADPNPKACGGAQFLRERGVQVEVGLLEAECRELIADFLHWQSTGLPFVTLKMASSLDGFIATRSGKSRWITGELARERVHVLRSQNQAVLVGGGTLHADDPLLNVRLDAFAPGNGIAGETNYVCWPGWERSHNFNQPRALVLASRELDPEKLPRLVRERGKEATLITVRGSPLAQQAELLAGYGVSLLEFEPGQGGRFDRVALSEILFKLRNEHALHRILCEGGSRLALELLSGGLVQNFELHQAPCLMADREAVNLFDGLAPDEVGDALTLELVRIGRLGKDTIMQFRPGE